MVLSPSTRSAGLDKLKANAQPPTHKPLVKTQEIKTLHLLMLLHLENTNQDDLNKLLVYAHQNHLKLSLIDNSNQPHLPGWNFLIVKA